MLPLREYRAAPEGFPDLIDHMYLFDDGVIVGKSGALMGGWEFRGPDMDSASGPELDDLAQKVNDPLTRLGSEWVMHVDAVRSPSSDYAPQGYFPDPTTWLIDEERRATYEAEGAHCETRTYLVLTYMPPSPLQRGILGFLNPLEASTDAGRPTSQDIVNFKASLRDVEGALSSQLRLNRLGTVRTPLPDGRERVDDTLLTHLNRCITGQDHLVAQPPPEIPLDCVIGGQDIFNDLADPRIGRKHLRVVSIIGYPGSTYPGIADILSRYNLQYRWSHRFHFMSRQHAEAEIEKARGNWSQLKLSWSNLVRRQMGDAPTHMNLHADAMADDAVVMLAKVSRGDEAFGLYCSQIVLMDDDRAVVDDVAKTVVRLVQNAGFNARMESHYCLPAYLSSIPGQCLDNLRGRIIHTRNLAHLLPLNNLWAGEPYNQCDMYPPDSPALARVSASGSTPFDLGVHVGDVGIFGVFGPTGAGKSTLLNFIAAQHFRYDGACVFAFDKGRSMMPLVLAAGGRHHDLSLIDEAAGSIAAQLQFQPLADIDKASERAWAEDWLATMAALQGADVNATRRVALHQAVELTARLPRHKRTLTDLQANVQDEVLRAALVPYTLGGSDIGQVFDGDGDGLGDADFDGFHCFETGDLFSLSPKFTQPLLLYIFHRVERSLRGQPAMILLGEAWSIFRHEMFCEKLREWLKTKRKQNCVVGFETSSIADDVLTSPIASTVIESCQTKIYLPNPAARSETVAAAYTRFGLSDRQITLLALAQAKRDYYYSSPLGQRLFSLELGPIQRAFLCAGDKVSLARVRELASTHPSVWPMQWLHERAVHPDWGKAWYHKLKALLESSPLQAAG